MRDKVEGMSRLLQLAILLFLLLPLAGIAAPLRVEVGVLSNGAKFIGDKTGGAEVQILDATTNEVLAEGITRGGTGSTSRIMGSDGGRYKKIASEDDAVFVAELELNEPRRVKITTKGPLGSPAAMNSSSMLMWLVPGHDLAGDNRVIETLSGYIIEPVEMNVDANGEGSASVDLQMLCGCPIKPGGTWDAERIHKTAVLIGPESRESIELVYSGEGTIYEARFTGKVKRPQSLRFDLVGMDDENTASLAAPLAK